MITITAMDIMITKDDSNEHNKKNHTGSKEYWIEYYICQRLETLSEIWKKGKVNDASKHTWERQKLITE